MGTATTYLSKFGLKSVHAYLGRWNNFFLMGISALLFIKISDVSMLTNENETGQSISRLCKFKMHLNLETVAFFIGTSPSEILTCKH